MKLPYYWKVQAEIGDAVTTSDGFSGKIASMEKGIIKILYDTPIKILVLYKKKKHGEYKFKQLYKI